MKMIAGSILVLAAVILHVGTVLRTPTPNWGASNSGFGVYAPPDNLALVSENLIAMAIGASGVLFIMWGAWEERFRRRD
jgi:hypothetical protein